LEDAMTTEQKIIRAREIAQKRPRIWLNWRWLNATQASERGAAVPLSEGLLAFLFRIVAVLSAAQEHVAGISNHARVSATS